MKQASLQKAEATGFHLHRAPKMIKRLETETNVMVFRGWGMRNMEFLKEFQFFKMKRVL